jgi:hypothetical protein
VSASPKPAPARYGTSTPTSNDRRVAAIWILRGRAFVGHHKPTRPVRLHRTAGRETNKPSPTVSRPRLRHGGGHVVCINVQGRGTGGLAFSRQNTPSRPFLFPEPRSSRERRQSRSTYLTVPAMPPSQCRTRRPRHRRAKLQLGLRPGAELVNPAGIGLTGRRFV